MIVDALLVGAAFAVGFAVGHARGFRSGITRAARLNRWAVAPLRWHGSGETVTTSGGPR